jgi:hypothetical protein
MWGMTEISPLGSLGSPKHCQLDGGLGEAELRDLKLSQARGGFGRFSGGFLIWRAFWRLSAVRLAALIARCWLI